MMETTQGPHRVPEGPFMPDEQWDVYRGVIRSARARGIQFALGGAFGYASYTGDWRNTKDLDLFVLPRDRDAMVEVLRAEGLEDYYARARYDRRWIYRGCRNNTLVDIIWAMANQRAQVDQRWFDAARTVELRGEELLVIPPEELLWQKLYIVQRDRCDWPDVLNIIHAAAALDWERLLERLGDDWPLLAGVLAMYGWLCPARTELVPRWLWARLRTLAPAGGSAPEVDTQRVCFLDSRPWFPSARIDPVDTPCPPW